MSLRLDGLVPHVAFPRPNFFLSPALLPEEVQDDLCEEPKAPGHHPVGPFHPRFFLHFFGSSVGKLSRTAALSATDFSELIITNFQRHKIFVAQAGVQPYRHPCASFFANRCQFLPGVPFIHALFIQKIQLFSATHYFQQFFFSERTKNVVQKVGYKGWVSTNPASAVLKSRRTFFL